MLHVIHRRCPASQGCFLALKARLNFVIIKKLFETSLAVNQDLQLMLRVREEGLCGAQSTLPRHAIYTPCPLRALWCRQQRHPGTHGSSAADCPIAAWMRNRRQGSVRYQEPVSSEKQGVSEPSLKRNAWSIRAKSSEKRRESQSSFEFYRSREPKTQNHGPATSSSQSRV